MKPSGIVFSFIVPVYNRPEDVWQLLDSFLRQQADAGIPYEIIVADDGSDTPAGEVVASFAGKLPVRYLYKPNSGPGDTRNYAMERASGEYFVILDSDVMLPEGYLDRLFRRYREGRLSAMGGGADTSHKGFPDFIKALDLSLTGLFTTGGIRGKKKRVDRYVPRSFNMIVHKKVFDTVGGFASLHPGEDPEWVYRAWDAGFSTAYYPELFVYHRRRSDWKQFWRQMEKFGIARGILRVMHPAYDSPVFYFPLIYSAGLILAVLLALFGKPLLLAVYVIYWLMILAEFLWKSRRIGLSLRGWMLFQEQMLAYATGWLKAFYKLKIKKMKPEKAFPSMFFRKTYAGGHE